MKPDPHPEAIERILAGNPEVKGVRIDAEKHDLEVGFADSVPPEPALAKIDASLHRELPDPEVVDALAGGGASAGNERRGRAFSSSPSRRRRDRVSSRGRRAARACVVLVLVGYEGSTVIVVLNGLRLLRAGREARV